MYASNTGSSINSFVQRRTLAIALMAGASLICASEAAAQSAPADNASTSQTSSQIQEVIVTARRRTEDLQKVPVAVSVVSSAVLTQQNRNNVIDLVAVLPSVGLRAQPENKDTDVLIRGLGTITTSAGAEPTVSTVIDGVVLAKPGQMVSDLIDVNNIEVLRGPQGTLFGKNASAGVINIITNNPTPAPGGYVDVGYYEGNEVHVDAVANGAINDVLSGRIAALYDRYPGNSENIYSDSMTDGYASEGFRAKLLYTPTDNLQILLSADYVESTGTGQATIFVADYNTAYPSGVKTYDPSLLTALEKEGITPSFTNTSVSVNHSPYMTDLTAGTSATVDYTFGGGYKLTSITAYRVWKNMQTGDTDGFSALTASTPTDELDLGHVDERQITEEVRLNSPTGHFLDYVIGAYFFDAPDREDYKRTTTQLEGATQVVNYGLNYFGATPIDYAAFGEANLNFTSSFRGIVGLRVVHDDLDFYSNRYSTSAVAVPGINPSFAATGSTQVNNYSDRFGLQYDVDPSTHAYFTYSRGYKGPAFNVFFNMNALETNALAPETSNDFELGLKSELFDHKALLNVALFDDHVDNYQANEPDVVDGTVVTRLINAGEVSTEGVEVDAVAKPVEHLTLTANYAYVDAIIDNFNCPPAAGVSCEVNGKPLPFAPKNKISTEVAYDMPLSDRFGANADVEYTYQSSQQDSILETLATIQPGYGIWNAGIGLTDNNLKWNVRLVVRNIANQHYYAAIAEANGGIIAQLPRDFSRYVGVVLHKDF